MEEQTDKNKKVKTYIGLVVGMVVAFSVQHFLFKKPSFDKQMMQAASEINKTCPIMIDAETRLDNTVALPNNVFQYNYTLVNMVKDSVDVEAIEKHLQPIILNTIKTSPDMESFRINNATISYSYKDKNNNYLTKLEFTSNDYK
jgi:hypothetical protein